MSLVIPPGFSQVVLRWGLVGDAEEMINTMGVSNSGITDFQDLANDIAQVTREFLPVNVILIGYSFLGVKLYVGQDGGPPAVYESVAVLHVGTNPGPALPPNCAYLVRKRTALGGRRGRGRMFMPAGVGPGEDSVPATGVMAEAQRVDLELRYNAWLDNWPVPLYLFHDDEALTPLPNPTPITTVTVEARLATTRRRLRP